VSKKAKWLDTLDDGEFDTAIDPGKKAKTKAPAYVRCYESHTPLVLTKGVEIYGGSCINPIITDADIYVGLDLSMKKSPKAFPWVEGESFLYHIQDMQAPKDPESFIELIDWLSVQLAANKKIHVGCIGGHGRTGTVFSALVNVMIGEKDAIEFVRQGYCKKAVESEEQVAFLHKHFGITKASPAKTHAAPWVDTRGTTSYPTYKGSNYFPPKVPLAARNGVSGAFVATPMMSKSALFGANMMLTKQR